MYFLGVDAGGTKTEAVIVDGKGSKVALGNGGPANYHNTGLNSAVDSVITAVGEALKNAELRAEDLSASCVGIAGLDTPYDRRVLTKAFEKKKSKFFGKNLILVNDAVIGLYTGTRPPGMCLISGTGSNCYGIGPDGKEAFAGNWSYLLGDQGGGYHLSLRIFRAIMRAFDGRGEPTVLRELVLNEIGIKNEYQLVDWVYKEKPIPGKVASFGKLLDKALRADDAVAKSIFAEHIDQLCANVKAVVKKTGLSAVSFEVVLIGSFFKTIGAVAAIEKGLKSCAPQACCVFPKISPAMGATILAKERITFDL